MHKNYFGKKSPFILVFLAVFSMTIFVVTVVKAATIVRKLDMVNDIEKIAAKKRLIGIWETPRYDVGESMESVLSSPLIPRPNKAAKIIEDTPEKTVYEAPFIIPGYTQQVEAKKLPQKVYYKLVITKNKNQTEYPLEYVLEPWQYRDKWYLGKSARGVIVRVRDEGGVFDLKSIEQGSAVTDMVSILEPRWMKATIIDDALGKYPNYAIFYRDTTTETIVSYTILICLGLGYYLWKKISKYRVLNNRRKP